MATAGIPLQFRWNREKAAFYFRFHADSTIQAPTEIFVPSQCFTGELSVSLKTIEKDGSLRWEYAREEQRLFVYNDGYSGEVELTGYNTSFSPV